MHDFIPVGTCVRFDGLSDVWRVEDCRPSQDDKTYFLRVNNLAGRVFQHEISTSLKLCDLPTPVKRENFFIPQTACPLCGANIRESISRFAVQQLFWKINIVECTECHLFFKEQFPSPDFLRHIYSQDYVHYAVEDKEPIDSLLESRVRRMGSPAGRHLDYGCAAGSFVSAAIHYGWDSYGADPFLPEKTVSTVPKNRLFRYDAASYEVDADTVNKMGCFNCISMWAVVEHLTAPDATFRNIAALLHPSGLLILNAPNPESIVARRDGSRWKLALLLEHLLFWSPACIAQVAGKYGLKLLRISICGSPYPFGRESPSQSAQGLHRLPFECFELSTVQRADDSGFDTTSSFNGERKTFWRKIASRSMRHILGNNMSSKRVDILRKIISSTHIGDHIEVVLQKI